MTREEMRSEFRARIERRYPGLVVGEKLLDDLDDAASQYTAGQIERACRGAYPWPPPARRREQGEAEGKTA